MFQKFIKEHQPDILCLQETKIDAVQLSKWQEANAVNQPEVDLPDYKEYWNSAEKKGYSGTAIFSKLETLKIIKNIPDEFVQASGLIADGYGDANKEGRVIAAEFSSYFVVTAYTPNAKDGLARIKLRQDWDKAITLYCAALNKQKPVIYCGDMNVAHTEDDLANPKANKGKKGFSDEERAGFDNWLAAGFIDTLRIFVQGNGHYTWWTHWANARARNIGWRIDYFLVSKDLKAKVKAATIHANVMGSDHCPVSVTLEV